MQRIVTLTVGERPIHIFSDMLAVHRTGAPRHTHRYPEVHIFLGGAGVYTVGGQTYRLASGDLILIPAGIPHETSCTADARVTAFETDFPADRVRTLHLAGALVDEIGAAVGRGTGAQIPVLYYLLARLLGEGAYTVSPNEDHGYLIDAYIEKNYHRQVRLAEVAAALCLSERQTQRVIRELTGGTFSEMLTAYRLSVAAQLEETTEMSRADIAAYVGFSTYSGFRRAECRFAQDKPKRRENEA